MGEEVQASEGEQSVSHLIAGDVEGMDVSLQGILKKSGTRLDNLVGLRKCLVCCFWHSSGHKLAHSFTKGSGILFLAQQWP